MRILFIFFISYSLYSQVTQQWASYYNGPGPSGLASDIVLASTTDAQGNTYITGRSANANFPGYGFDIATVKFNSAGVQQWSVRYTGAQNRNDQGQAIVVDGSGNVYVTGYEEINSSDAKMITIKYNSSGIQQWVADYSSSYSTAIGNSIALDGSNNVYVTGWCDSLISGSGKRQYTTIKYNSGGILQWIKKYNFSNSDAEAIMVKTDASANVYITGRSNALGTTQWDYATIKYNTNGDQLWVSRFSSSTGITDDEASALYIDNTGNVYVTGKGSFTSGSPFDYVTVKYNSSGAELWNARYNGTGNQSDIANCITTDGNGNIYVSGGSWGGAAEGYDFAVVKYNPAGIQQWASRYNNSSADYVYSMLVDDSSNLYVTGFDGAYKTIKYNSAGIEQWSMRFNSGTINTDYLPYVSKDNLNNIYISGSSIQSSANSYDYTVIKYSQVLGINIISSEIPAAYKLFQNYPNPFNPSTKIRFALPKNENVYIAVYNVKGQVVAVIVNSTLKPGSYEAELDGSMLSSGLYFYRFTAGNYSETKKMIMIK